jgi:site-specific DNA recombinase
MMGQVLKKLSHDSEQEEKRLKLQLSELKKCLDTQECRYAFGDIDREIFLKFSKELKGEMKEVEVNLEKLAGPLSNHQNWVGNGLKIMLSLSGSWVSADVSQRKRLQATVFPGWAAYDREKEAYRNTRINSFFAGFRELAQLSAQKERGESDSEIHFSLLVDRRGIEQQAVIFCLNR